MDPILHTIIAIGCMASCYYAGDFLAKKNSFDPIVSGLLNKLESEGFIRSRLGKDGDRELIPISEITAQTLRDSVKLSK